MSARNFYHRYPSDALAGMQSLSLEERGAYNTILDLIYDREGPIPDNPYLIAGYMNCSVRKWKSLRQALIEKGKIELTADNEISNSRAFFELENRLKTSRKRAENEPKTPRKRAENPKFLNENNETPSDPRAGARACGLPPETRDHIPNLPVRDARADNIAVLMKAARFVVPPDDHRYVEEWMGLGLRLDQIEAVIADIAARQIAAGNPPRIFKYFDRAVRRAAQNPETLPDNREWWEKPENVTQLTEEEMNAQRAMLAWEAEQDRLHEERQKSRNLN